MQRRAKWIISSKQNMLHAILAVIVEWTRYSELPLKVSMRKCYVLSKSFHCA